MLIVFMYIKQTSNFNSSFHTLAQTHTKKHTHTPADTDTDTHKHTHTVSQHFWDRNLFTKCQMSSGPSGPIFMSCYNLLCT